MSMNQRQKIEKAIRFLEPVHISISKKKQPGMRPQDADAVALYLSDAIADLRSVLTIYNDADRRNKLMQEHPKSGGHGG